MATAFDKSVLRLPVRLISLAAILSLLGGYTAAAMDRSLSLAEHLCFATSLLVFASVPIVWEKRESPPTVVATLLVGGLLPAITIPIESGLGLRAQMLVWTGVCLTLLAGCIPFRWSVIVGIATTAYLTALLPITPETLGETTSAGLHPISTWTLWWNYCALNCTGLTIGASARRFIIWAMSSNEREQANRRVESERIANELQNLISASPESLLTISTRDGSLLFANVAATRLLSLESEAITSYDPSTLLSQQSEGFDLSAFLQKIADEKTTSIGIATDTKGNEIPVSISAVRSRGIVGEDDWFYVFAHDLRAERAYQQDLRRAERRLEEARRTQSNARFAAGVAHDFANIMTIVRLCAEELSDAMSTPDDREESADALDQALNSADGLIAELSSLSSPSRPGRNQAEPAPCLDTIKSTISLTRKTLPEGIRLTTEYPAADAEVALPALDLARVVNNLVINAANVLGESGNISVEVNVAEPGNTSPTAPHPAGSAGTLLIRVADDGPGVPEEIRDQIFEPYFTTRPRDGGTGLGLSTSRAILAQVGGTIELDPGHRPGARFEIAIPIAVAAPAGTTPAPETAKDPRKILLVDDDELFRASLARNLGRFEYSVLEAGDVSEAIEILEQNTDACCVITDLVMPDQRGTDLVAWIESRALPIGIIAISGWLGRDSSEKLREFSESMEFLQKPFDTKVLLETIEKVSATASARR